MLFKSKKIIYSFLGLILIVATMPIFSAFEAHIVNVTATIDNPVKLLTSNGEEVLPIGECYLITWTADEGLPRLGNVSSVDIYYSTDSGNSYPNLISAGETNDGCYNWKVPNDPTDQGRIMVLVHYNGTDAPDQVDYSDENFDIAYTADGNTAALWHFNEENDATTALDETGNNDGTLKPESSLPVWTTDGRYKNALKFDGVDDYVEVSDSDSLDITNQITIEAWIKHNETGVYDGILQKGSFLNNFGAYSLWITNEDKLRFRVNSDPYVTSQTTIGTEWTHVAATYSKAEGKMKLYINGIKDPNEVSYFQSIYTDENFLRIGMYYSNNFMFKGIIDEVRISNIARDFNIDCENNGCDGEGDGEEDSTPVPPEEGDVVINEIMWMGSKDNPYDEWIELRNITDNEISLDDCILTKKKDAEDEEIADLTGLTILPASSNGYLVISRKDKEDSKIDVDTQNILAHQALSNSKLKIKLICSGMEIDTAGDGNKPLAGDNGDIKKSMSRCDDGTWQTATIGGVDNNWDAETNELGTPGAANSCPE